MAESSSQLRRFRMDVAYDGRPFAGWQSQVGGDTVQDVLLAALRAICPAIRTVQGSGRTDAGVSADRQVAHFDAPADWRMGGAEWRKALNAGLPATVRVMGCGEVDEAFHARFSALEKVYRYEIATGEVLPPLRAGLAWHCRGIGSAPELAEAVSIFEGAHDFRAFSAKRRKGEEPTDTVRTIHTAEVESVDDGLFVRFRGDGFLYKMVRFLVGSAVYCTRGKVTQDELRALLDGADPERKAPFCAPAAGLFLEDVRYPNEFDIPRSP